MPTRPRRSWRGIGEYVQYLIAVTFGDQNHSQLNRASAEPARGTQLGAPRMARGGGGKDSNPRGREPATVPPSY